MEQAILLCSLFPSAWVNISLFAFKKYLQVSKFTLQAKYMKKIFFLYLEGCVVN